MFERVGRRDGRVAAVLAVGRALREVWLIHRELIGSTTGEAAEGVTRAIGRLATGGAVAIRCRGRETRVALASRASEDDGWRTRNYRIPSHSRPGAD